MARAGPKRRKPASRRRRRHKRTFPWGRLLLVAALLLAGYVVWLDVQIRAQFEGKRWALPAQVYASPMELYAGRALSRRALVEELDRLDYRRVSDPRRPGEMAVGSTDILLHTRSFRFWDGQEQARNLRVRFSGGRIAAISARDRRGPVDLVRLDPVRIASIYPARKEDRILVRLDELPPLLVQTLLAVEDRNFHRHHGISVRSILRALWVNLRAGGVVQGGSTITQQLVKNFFLTNKRSLGRKLNEAIMALLLEWHYGKDEILEAYFNEVYLGQDGARAIHGIGLASHFYFDRPVEELSADQMALLIGMIKGPSLYDPRRHPERALERRNLVLDVLAEQGVLTPEEAAVARSRPLGVLKRRPTAVNRYPAFLELVRRQLHRDYDEEDLTSAGLRIFTTLEPRAQELAEQALSRRLKQLEKARQLPPDSLQGAVLVTSTSNAEVLAVVGDRAPRAAGFNRALDARRPIGSLVKPAVYLTALEQPQRYTLASVLADEPFRLELPNGDVWAPQNYDRKFRGRVLLYQALVHSYNVPTARLGMAIGVERVVATLRRLGADRAFRAYPSFLLGAAAMTPAEVTQVYQTLAAGGFRSPLRSIRAVLDARGEPLQRYPLRVEQVVEAVPNYLIVRTLQRVFAEGTAAGAPSPLPRERGLAGKTGTTNELRDSWFAGFGGDVLATVWVGRDDNGPMGLTGASGALRVWTDLMVGLDVAVLMPAPPESVEEVWIDSATGLRSDPACANSVQLPFLKGSAPTGFSECARREQALPDPIQWLKDLMR